MLRTCHLLSFKATFEAFLDVTHICSIFSYWQCSAERSQHFSWEAVAHSSVHFLSVQTANKPVRKTDTHTHVQENTNGEE